MRLGEGVLLMQNCISAIALQLVKISNLEQVFPIFHLIKGILVLELGKIVLLTSVQQAVLIFLAISMMEPVAF